MYVRRATEPELPLIQNWFTKPFIYEIGSHDGCACPFAVEPDGENPDEEILKSWNENHTDFVQLGDYLKSAITVAGPVELYNATDFWEEPLARRTIAIAQITGDRFVFAERELVRVVAD